MEAAADGACRGPLAPPRFADELLDPTLLEAADDAALVTCLKQAMARVDAELERRFHAQADIQQLVTARAWAVDELLIFAWSALCSEPAGMALIAVGGYGRGQLHPHSDVDLLILFEADALDPQAQCAVERFVTVLWDAGFYLGHSVRNLSQCREDVATDVSTATSLMEIRRLSGPEGLAERLQASVAPSEIWSAGEFFHAKFAEQQARHEQFGETAYNLEPNIKEGPGGLRDIQMVGWVAKRHFGTRNLHGLVKHGFLHESEYRELVEGQRYLWRVRFALHLLSGRAEDRLLFDFQRRIAEWFGYGGDPASNEAVEQFMQGYYREVTRLERLNERLLQLFQEQLLSPEQTLVEPLGQGFQLRRGYLEVADAQLFQQRPQALMELFLLLARHADIAGVRASTIRLIVDHLHLVDASFCRDPEVLACFLELLRQPQGVYTQLQRMNRYGMLARFLPAFGNIVGRMQFDLFHVYTVDQHTLFVVRNLRRFAYGKYQELYPHAAPVFQAIDRPELLYLAAIFHDIAKGRGGDHSELGAVDAQQFCSHLSLDAGDAELVAWLVEQHLLMSQTAQKKDISDPETVREFADRVQTLQRLDYLYLLTVADISATSPRLWNGWKGGLLWELREATRHMLAQDPETPQHRSQAREQTRAAALALLQDAGIETGPVEAFWDTLPLSVLRRYSPSQLAWATGVRLDRPEEQPLVALRPRAQRDVTEVLVVAADYQGLFASMTSVFDALGLEVLAARIATGKDGLSFDLFQLMNRQGKPLDEGDSEVVRQRLLTALATEGVPTPSRRRLPRRLRPFVAPPEITFRESHDGRMTELELNCTDEPGLLSKVAAALHQSGVRIHDAMITTLGDRVEDTFVLSDAAGQPLGHEQQAALERALLQTLEHE